MNAQKVLFNLAKIKLLLILPFVLLLRGSMYFHEQLDLNPWACLGLGSVLVVILLIIYFSVLFGKISTRFGGGKQFKLKAFLALALVMGYVGYGILYLSAANAKTQEVKSEFQELHPIIRMGISTLVFIDKDLLITDAARVPEDYQKMGLKTANTSLHYKQSSGYVHAVDIRTNGRPEFRNQLIEMYFKAMGFTTLRHTGTADHLHVSLYSKDHPNAR